MHESPTFRCGEYNFSLHGDPSSVASVAAAFADLTSGPNEFTIRWWLTDNGGQISLTVGNTNVADDVPRHLLPAVAASTLTRHVIDHEAELLHLHAAAVVDDGAAIVIAGPSGSGKSTLCAAMVSTGSAYVSDEMIAVDPQTHRLSSFPKPISVKKYAISTVEQTTRLTAPADRNAPWMVVASQLGTLAANDDHLGRTIVLYRHDRDSPTTIEPVHRATVVRELLADSQDAERLGPDALSVVARFVARAQCLRSTGADASEIAATLRREHAQPVVDGSFIEHDTPSDNGSGPRRRSHITSVQLDGRAILFDSETSRIIELDEATSAWWSLFDGTPLDLLAQECSEELDLRIDDAVASARSAEAQLVELGMI